MPFWTCHFLMGTVNGPAPIAILDNLLQLLKWMWAESREVELFLVVAACIYMCSHFLLTRISFGLSQIMSDVFVFFLQLVARYRALHTSVAPHSFQITQCPTGSTRVPREKSAVRTPSTRSWSWRKSSSLTPTWPGTVGTRWRGC